MPGQLVNTLGGSKGFGENELPANDDGSSAAIDITSVFGPAGIKFFGTNYTQLYVNNNGNITFTGPLSDYTPGEISGGSGSPIIAAFWADVDTEGGPLYSPTPGGTSTGANKVFYDLDPATGIFTATWDDVGYYNDGTDKANAFQIQLINRGAGNFDIVFRYENIEWSNGDAARAGFSAGDGVNYFELPQSGNEAQVLDLENATGNSGQPGFWSFEVRNGQPTNLNAAPTQIGLTSSTVAENSGTGTVVGSLITTDPNVGDSHSYTLLDNAGGRFAISGGNLVVANGALLDFEQAGQHTVTVRSTDHAGLTVDRVLTISIQDVNPEAAVGSAGNDILRGGVSNDTLSGGEGNDVLDGGAGDDTLEGGGGDDAVDGGEGNDTIVAGHGGGNDTYSGGFGIDLLKYASTLLGIAVDLKSGKAQGKEINDDTIRDIENVLGGAGGDSIKGNDISNHLSGGAGNDVLEGGMGQDTLEGGAGADRFVFSSAKESARGALRDMVVGFEKGVDDIDLSLIDAEKGKGNQRFSWVDKGDLDAKFTGDAGELRYKGGVLSGDTNGDKRADFEIHIGTKIGAGDVIL